MSARTRVLAIVGAAAALAVAAVVGGTLLQTRGQTTVVPGAVTKPRPGYPPLQLDFGVRSDAEARALARAQRLYEGGKVAQADAVFGRYGSLEARIGAAFAAWPRGDGLAALKRLAAAHPRSALVQLHLGWADYWAGRVQDAAEAWTLATRVQPDTPYAVDAQDALHPRDVPGLPPIVTGIQLPQTLRTLPAAQQLAALRRAAAGPDATAKLLYGVALWNLKRPVSARRQLVAAAKLAPDDPVVRTAAAVSTFTKAAPVRAFGRLGPLTGVFPKAAVVRFHLGLVLLYVGERKKAAAQLRLAVADDPQAPYAKEADVLLSSLAQNGT